MCGSIRYTQRPTSARCARCDTTSLRTEVFPRASNRTGDGPMTAKGSSWCAGAARAAWCATSATSTRRPTTCRASGRLPAHGLDGTRGHGAERRSPRKVRGSAGNSVTCDDAAW